MSASAAARPGEARPPQAARGDLRLYARVLGQARPYWRHIGAVFLLSVLSSSIALLTPLPLKIAVDAVIGSHPVPSYFEMLLPEGAARSDTTVLVIAAGLGLGIALLSQLAALAAAVLRVYTGEKLALEFRARLFGHLNRLSLAYHDAKGTSESLYRIQYDAPAIQHIAADGVMPFVTAAVMLVGMIYVTARIDWQLACVALAVSPLLFLSCRVYARRLRSEWTGMSELESSALSVVQETLGAVRVVKAFGQEEREQARYFRRASESVQGRLRLAVMEGSIGLVTGLIIAAGTAAVLFIGALHVQSGAITLGELLLVMAYLAQLYAPLQTMSSKAVDLQSSLAGAERAFAILDQAPDVEELPGARPLSRARGSVSFRGVSFGYGDGRLILKDVSFDVRAGARVGIVGTTGGGKTTLVNLLTRFYDPTAGQVMLDETDLREYRLVDLRAQFAIVLQDPVLFSTSVAENITYARPEASEDEIVEAAKAANAHEFIVQLPDGYQTVVGERGMRLSGGERQRVSLARAFLKNAPVLILDEPTSSVDTITEAAIMGSIERLMQGRTTLMIAHRLSTLSSCDMRIEISEGRAIEQLDALAVRPSSGEIREVLRSTAGEPG